ncbi:MFS transporter [Actinophytocola xinjiangensis]|uniref:MFS transporter n=1 Tax=Actinophytocola xinjiangensis TaxID=485602 RepID=A0A7Z0WKX4_9PSEU|nr:MFS transporter [Actinophytocola xinjiangensis]OLF09751.1 MFS transporter [Actinophytocola xinjiangensis]
MIETGTPPSKGVWTRAFTLFFAARTVSILGDQMLIPITVTVAVLQAGYGVSGVGFALAAHTAPLAAFVILGGVLVDRLTPIRVMVAADLARVVIHATLVLSFVLGTPDLWLIITVMALSGVCTAAFQPGYASVIPRVAVDVQKANAAIRVAEALVAVAGPAAAGLILSVAPVSVVLAIDTATYALSAVFLLLMRLRIPRPESTASFRRDLVQGWHEFRSRRWLWNVIVIYMLFQVTVNGPSLTLGPSLITLDHGERTLGFVMATFGAGAVLGGLAAARFRPRYPLRAGAIAMVGGAFSLLALALHLPPPLIAAGYLLHGVAGAFWLVMFHSSVQTHIPPDVLGRVHAYDVAGSLVMRPVGQTAAGPAALWVGAAPVLFFSTAMLLVTVGLLLAAPAVRGLRNLRPGRSEIG